MCVCVGLEPATSAPPSMGASYVGSAISTYGQTDSRRLAKVEPSRPYMPFPGPYTSSFVLCCLTVSGPVDDASAPGVESAYAATQLASTCVHYLLSSMSSYQAEAVGQGDRPLKKQVEELIDVALSVGKWQYVSYVEGLLFPELVRGYDAISAC